MAIMNRFIKQGLGVIFAVSVMACATPPKPPFPVPQTSENQPSNHGGITARGETPSFPTGAPRPNSDINGLERANGLPNITPGAERYPSAIDNFQITFSDYLPRWNQADLRPALMAFARNCPIWENRDSDKALKTSKPEFGIYAHWQDLCQRLPAAPYNEGLARWFFETYFLPANLLTSEPLEGLLTGYYEPEIEVRAHFDAEFSEPILAKPEQDDLRQKPRKDIYRNQVDYRVLAYGRPIDVFFMQIQGSGRIRFENGNIKRAAYGGNNGYKYKSIGGVLIQRQEVTREQASKQAIEDWMIRAGSTAARNLMNENPRYIYFALQDIKDGEGPDGSMRAPLTAMGSMAIDPVSRPYGVPVWLETTLPQFSGDYRGKPQSLLVIAQDTGNAIKGPARGDLFFGSGAEAGELAGVMKHDVTMTHLLPRTLVTSQLGLR